MEFSFTKPKFEFISDRIVAKVNDIESSYLIVGPNFVEEASHELACTKSLNANCVE